MSLVGIFPLRCSDAALSDPLCNCRKITKTSIRAKGHKYLSSSKSFEEKRKQAAGLVLVGLCGSSRFLPSENPFETQKKLLMFLSPSRRFVSSRPNKTTTNQVLFVHPEPEPACSSVWTRPGPGSGPSWSPPRIHLWVAAGPVLVPDEVIPTELHRGSGPEAEPDSNPRVWLPWRHIHKCEKTSHFYSAVGKSQILININKHQ